MVRSRNKSGFTLIELLAVAALVGLLAGVTLLRYARMGSQTILINQSRQVYLAAKYARIAAIEQQKPMVLKLDETQRQIVLDAAQQNESMETQNRTATETEAMPLPVKNAYFRPILLDNRLWIEQFLVDSGDNKAMECLFYPDGTAQTCVIQIGDGQRHASILITQTGRAKLQMNAVAQIPSDRVDLDETE